MSFDSIPADLLLKMFDRLPFKDRVRLRGVNQLFNEISWKSINTLRSLEINDDLVAYLTTTSFFSLLESCSPNLGSIKAIYSSSCSKWLLNALTKFVYPKLERLEITVSNNELTKKLISRTRILRSVDLYLDREFEWPDDVVFEKLENLYLFASENSNGNSYVNLSPTLRPLIGKVPNLECLWIDIGPKTAHFILSVEELNQLLAAAPCLKVLHLSLYHDSTSIPYNNVCGDFITAMPTWHLPNLITMIIILKCPIPFPPSILHFSTTFPQLKWIWVGMVTEIDDQALVALSKLKQLRQLSLPDLEMRKDNLSMMVTLLPSITVLNIKKIDRQALLALPQLQHLHAFSVFGMEMTKVEIINVITNLPSLSMLEISAISYAGSLNSFTDFLTSTAALFHRNLKIRLTSMHINGNESDLEQMKGVLEDIEKNGGPVVEMDGRNISMIHYKSSA